ncbi:MAG: hypothetical protein P8Y01_14640 [Woeseiaceae bacterium]
MCNGGDLPAIDVVGQKNVEEAAVASFAVVILRQQFGEIAVEVVDRGHIERQCPPDTGRDRDVAGERNADLVGRRGGHFELVPRQAGMDLDEIVARRVLLAHHPARLLGAVDRAPVEGRTGRHQAWTEGGAGCKIVA